MSKFRRIDIEEIVSTNNEFDIEIPDNMSDENLKRLYMKQKKKACV